MPARITNSPKTFTPVPNVIFDKYLTNVRDITELKIALRLIHLNHQYNQQDSRGIPETELTQDSINLQLASANGKPPVEEIKDQLENLLSKGLCIRYHTEDNEGNLQTFYMLNNGINRATLQFRKIKHEDHRTKNPPATPPPQKTHQSPTPSANNIYALYMDNIGDLGASLAEELKDTEERYPHDVIQEAFRLAIFNNRLSWSYITQMLRRFDTYGDFSQSPLPPAKGRNPYAEPSHNNAKTDPDPQEEHRFR